MYVVNFFTGYCIALNFRGSLILWIFSRIFNRLWEYCNENLWHAECEVHVQWIHEIISKTVICENLDPWNFCAIQYIQVTSFWFFCKVNVNSSRHLLIVLPCSTSMAFYDTQIFPWGFPRKIYALCVDLDCTWQYPLSELPPKQKKAVCANRVHLSLWAAMAVGMIMSFT